MKDKIQLLVLRAIESFNRTLPAGKRLECARETELLGPSQSLDSMDFLTLTLELEDRIQKETGISIQLFDLDLVAGSNPFRTVGTLVDYLVLQTEKSAGKNSP